MPCSPPPHSLLYLRLTLALDEDAAWLVAVAGATVGLERRAPGAALPADDASASVAATASEGRLRALALARRLGEDATGSDPDWASLSLSLSPSMSFYIN